MTEKESIVDSYDTLIGVKDTKSKPATLSSFLDLSDDIETEEEAWDLHNYQNWREEWKGMPSYESENIKPVKYLQINFRTVEDFLAFSEVIGQKLTLKTKSVAWPLVEKDVNSLKRWISDDEV